jgi:hypothetical protein
VDRWEYEVVVGAALGHETVGVVRKGDGTFLFPGSVTSLDVIVAPPASSTFFPRYNPRVVTPFFCFVDRTGQVAARGPVGAGDWLRLRGAWEGTTTHAARQRMAR